MTGMNLQNYFEAQGRGAATRLSRAIGAHSSDVSSWAKCVRPVPVKFAVAIEAATEKQVTRKDLFPDDWDLIWPELAEMAVANV